MYMVSLKSNMVTIFAPLKRVVIAKATWVGLLIIVLLITAGALYWKYRQTATQLATISQQSTQAEDEQLMKDVGALIILPAEEPTIATVTDKEQLANQPFFVQAQNGDKVIIYTASKKAILYRPSDKKIVDIAPLIIDNPTPSAPDTTETKATPVTLTLLNGSTKVGVTNIIDDQLLKSFPTVSIVTKEAAKKTDYTQTLVIDVSGKNAQLAAQLAQQLKGVVSTLPPEEGKPSSELLVIVGNN
jgi:hypothetical protein